MTVRTIHVPYALDRDEDGVWCARAELHPGVTAYGDGATREEALDDLREGIVSLVEEFGVPDELTVTVPVAA